jgi:hypothetical protein
MDKIKSDMHQSTYKNRNLAKPISPCIYMRARIVIDIGVESEKRNKGYRE